jgi:hypothetical protein
MRSALALVLALTLLLPPGCASIVNAPKLYGGTKALLDNPFPITDATIELDSPLGAPKRRVANPVALTFINIYWIVDFVPTFALDTLLAPLAIWVFGDDDAKKAAPSHHRAAPPPAAAAPEDDLPPPAYAPPPGRGDAGLPGGGGAGGDPLAPQ